MVRNELKFFLEEAHLCTCLCCLGRVWYSASYYLTSLLETQASLSNSIILIRRIAAASNTISIVSDSYFFAISCCDAKKFLLSLKDTVLSFSSNTLLTPTFILFFLERYENNTEISHVFLIIEQIHANLKVLFWYVI